MQKNSEKKFRKITGRFYGQSDEVEGEVQVNVELIWNLTQNEDKFIKIFSQTHSHELLHIIIAGIVDQLFYFKEEKIIRSILGEEWNKELAKYYKEMSRG